MPASTNTVARATRHDLDGPDPAGDLVPRAWVDADHYPDLPHVVLGTPKEHAFQQDVAPHSHQRTQLLYAIDGVMRVTTDVGVWLIPPRRALLIAPGVTHALTTLSRVSLRSLYIVPSALPHFSTGCRLIEVSNLLRELVLALITDPREVPAPGRGAQLAALVLLELAAAETVPIKIPWPRDRRLVGVCNAIMADPGRTRTIDDWGAEVGASGRTLMRLFPRETGLPFRQWVQQVQLADAFCRLARGDSVGSIASALGYASPSAFTAMFRRVLGHTPQHYLGEWRTRV
jgi:AraC-like DNA-binding protein/quercetin dioxygenase-like cupin family protein